jgi:1-acyl-sn-glycerol-3-phosphate acyltransferase
VIRALWRAPQLLFLAVAYPAAVALRHWRARDAGAARREALRLNGWICRSLLRVLGVTVDRRRLRSVEGPALLVCNHVSFLDIFVLGALFPAVFIPSVELREAPVVGRFAAWGGSFFVERRHRAGMRGEVEDLGRLMAAGFSAILFPEGTTSDGAGLLPFKSGFFEAAILARCPVAPLCINYLEVDGAPLTAANRNTFFYYGGMTLVRQFGRLMRARSVRAEVVAGAPITTDGAPSRKALAEAAQAAIAAVHRPVR